MARELGALLGILFSQSELGNLQATLAHLREDDLLVKDLLGLLEASNLGCAVWRAILVCFWLGDAAVLDLAIVLHKGGSSLEEMHLSDVSSATFSLSYADCDDA